MTKRRSTWTGRKVTKARAEWAQRLPTTCPRCHQPVLPEQVWHLDHWPIPQAQGGTQVVTAHEHCNESAGGKLGAALTNARRWPAQPRVVESF